jgi:hypothetical protein
MDDIGFGLEDSFGSRRKPVAGPSEKQLALGLGSLLAHYVDRLGERDFNCRVIRRGRSGEGEHDHGPNDETG